jgi:Serine protease gd N-terminus
MVLLVMVKLNFTAGQISPCPDVFLYAFNASSFFFGIVTVPSPQFGMANTLEITLSLPILLPNVSNLLQFDQPVWKIHKIPLYKFFQRYNGSIDVMTDKSHVLQNILRGKMLRYRVELPVQQPLATVTLILLNGQSICLGPKDPNELIEIHLNHTLTTSWKKPSVQPVQPEVHQPIPNMLTDDQLSNLAYLYELNRTLSNWQSFL